MADARHIIDRLLQSPNYAFTCPSSSYTFRLLCGVGNHHALVIDVARLTFQHSQLSLHSQCHEHHQHHGWFSQLRSVYENKRKWYAQCFLIQAPAANIPEFWIWFARRGNVYLLVNIVWGTSGTHGHFFFLLLHPHFSLVFMEYKPIKPRFITTLLAACPTELTRCTSCIYYQS